MSAFFRLLSIATLAGLVVVGLHSVGRAQDAAGGGYGSGHHGDRGDRGDRAGGRVTAIGDRTITVSRRDGSSATIAITDTTTFTRNGAAAHLSDFRAGDFVFAHGARDANGQFVATEVMGGDKRPERHDEPH
jgi:hypothetical protein